MLTPVPCFRQYFDELRGLLPYGGDSAKFDKNAILHHSILLIKQVGFRFEYSTHHSIEKLIVDAVRIPGTDDIVCAAHRRARSGGGHGC